MPYNFTWWRHQIVMFSALLTPGGGIHRSSVNFPHKDQRREALMFSLICARINGCVNNRYAGDLRRHRANYVGGGGGGGGEGVTGWCIYMLLYSYHIHDTLPLSLRDLHSTDKKSSPPSSHRNGNFRTDNTWFLYQWLVLVSSSEVIFLHVVYRFSTTDDVSVAV